MLKKHIDAIALLVILLGSLAISKAPDTCLFRGMTRAAVHIQNAIERIESRHLRDVVNYSVPDFR